MQRRAGRAKLEQARQAAQVQGTGVNSPFGTRRVAKMAGLLMLLGGIFAAPGVQAQDGEVWAQKPFIMLLVDTSGSMEWTNEGDEFYPSDGEHAPWKLTEPLSGNDMPTYYGPCRVWGPSCNVYDRPSWRTSDYTGNAGAAVNDMRGGGNNPGHRLSVRSQPRHISLKETLTGDMILRPRDSVQPDQTLSREEHGPGCWLVPRQRGSSNNGNICLDSPARFESYPDHTDPLPHFQEVFDFQKENGLMDLMGTHAIFGLAMLDSYPNSKRDIMGLDSPAHEWGGNYYGGLDINDVMNDEFAGLDEGDGGPPGLAGNDNYNLGVFQMVVPRRFDAMNPVEAGRISSFVQTALVDSGYLYSGTSGQMLRADDGQIDVSNFLNDYELGRQPIARATPLAAAIYDIHQFFAEGSSSTGQGASSSTRQNGPVRDDPYLQCRPKQVVVVTDGMPEPERPGGEVSDLPDTLNPTFGYNVDQYPYANSEQSINFFVNDLKYEDLDEVDGLFTGSTRSSSSSYLAGTWDGGGEDYERGRRYNPRVHIVGINAVNEPVVVKKMAEMAIEGKSCAQYYLKSDWLPIGYKDHDGVDGTCEPDHEFCLDPTQAEYVGQKYQYLPPDGDGTSTVTCRFPAFILKEPVDYDGDVASGLVERTKAGLQLLFNQIVASGMSSRTRPTYVNYLDDPSAPEGGQFSYFTGTTIDPGKTFWRGRLYRQANLCAPPDGHDPFSDLSEEINELAGHIELKNDGTRVLKEKDKRRIFTSFSSWHPGYSTDPDAGYNRSVQDSRFSLNMPLAKAKDDQFGDGYLWVKPAELVNTRVPFLEEYLGVYDITTQGLQNRRSLEQYFNAYGDDLLDLIDEVRGRSDNKQGRAFGAILNASPIAVEPPDQALPIDSYRDFQARYANRPSMIYAATTDGLLHAIYAGQLKASTDDMVTLQQDESVGKSSVKGTMKEQREAWAYLPQMMHTRLQDYKGSPPELLDGTPTVKDVRLCHLRNPGETRSIDTLNTNLQACAYSGGEEPDAAYQWRTVLVAGLGEYGAGYFALDVTRPGGKAHQSNSADTEIVDPDPIPLWEFDREWERLQVKTLLASNHRKLVGPQSATLPVDSACPGGDNPTDGWKAGFLGRSVGSAAIGTVVIKGDFSNSDSRLPVHRPVAVFGGGMNKNPVDDCQNATAGKAIFVLDMQSGSLIKRFVTYRDKDNIEVAFDAPISGSPALYDGSPGSLVTRGFIGDAKGRLYRMDMADADPANWEVKLFFDPAEDLTGSDYDQLTKFGPAAFKPAIAKSTSGMNNDLLVFYGLGEGSDLSADGSVQLMIAVREEVTMTANGGVTIEGTPVWHHEFDRVDDSDVNTQATSEALTSEPVVFNGGVYFTTFVEPTHDRCAPGWSRIYGMSFDGDFSVNHNMAAQPLGVFYPHDADPVNSPRIPLGTQCVPSTTNCMAYEPTNTANLTESVVVRGLTITMGMSCLPPLDEDGDYDENTTPVQSAKSGQTPVLMAQSTSDQLFGDQKQAVGGSVGNTADTIFSGELELAQPRSQFIPLSWAVIDN